MTRLRADGVVVINFRLPSFASDALDDNARVGQFLAALEATAILRFPYADQLDELQLVVTAKILASPADAEP